MASDDETTRPHAHTLHESSAEGPPLRLSCRRSTVTSHLRKGHTYVSIAGCLPAQLGITRRALPRRLACLLCQARAWVRGGGELMRRPAWRRPASRVRVHMNAFLYIHAHTCTHACLDAVMSCHACVRMYVCTHECVCMCACKHAWMFACIYVCPHECMYVLTCVCVYVSMHTSLSLSLPLSPSLPFYPLLSPLPSTLPQKFKSATIRRQFQL